MLIFVVARTRLDRYEELCRQFETWRDVSIILDRREGDRRTGQGTYVGVNRCGRVDRRRVDVGYVLNEARVVRCRYRRVVVSGHMSLLPDLATFIVTTAPTAP